MNAEYNVNAAYDIKITNNLEKNMSILQSVAPQLNSKPVARSDEGSKRAVTERPTGHSNSSFRGWGKSGVSTAKKCGLKNPQHPPRASAIRHIKITSM